MIIDISRRVEKWDEDRQYFRAVSPHQIKSGDLLVLLDNDGSIINEPDTVIKATNDVEMKVGGGLSLECREVEFTHPEDLYRFRVRVWMNEHDGKREYVGEIVCSDEEEALDYYIVNLGLGIPERFKDSGEVYPKLRVDNVVMEKIDPSSGKRILVKSCYYPEVKSENELE